MGSCSGEHTTSRPGRCRTTTACSFADSIACNQLTKPTCDGNKFGHNIQKQAATWQGHTLVTLCCVVATVSTVLSSCCQVPSTSTEGWQCVCIPVCIHTMR